MMRRVPLSVAREIFHTFMNFIFANNKLKSLYQGFYHTINKINQFNISIK